jgi:hypothetical protein
MRTLLLSLAILLFVGAGCTPAAAVPAAPAGPVVQTVDGLTFTISWSPSQLQSRESATVEVRLVDGQGQPVEGGRMVIALESRGHAMTPNISTAEPKGSGVYQATLKPAGMTGEHVIIANVQWQGKSYRATFGGINVR